MTNSELYLVAGFGLVVLLATASKESGAPIGAISPQPAQRARDAGLVNWLGLVDAQNATWNNAQTMGRQSIDPLINYTSPQ